MRLSVPDLEVLFKHFEETQDFESIKTLLFGGQKYDFDFHYHGWTFDTLKRDLNLLGFDSVQRYDWHKTEHFFVDDYSQSYLPHMDKQHGKLMSLNVEAIKK